MYKAYFKGNDVIRGDVRQTRTDVYTMYFDTLEHRDMKTGSLEFNSAGGAVRFYSDIYPDVYIHSDTLESSYRYIVLQSPDLYCIIQLSI